MKGRAAEVYILGQMLDIQISQYSDNNFDEEYQIHDRDAIGVGGAEKIKPILFLQLEKTWCSDAEWATKQEGRMHNIM